VTDFVLWFYENSLVEPGERFFGVMKRRWRAANRPNGVQKLVHPIDPELPAIITAQGDRLYYNKVDALEAWIRPPN